MADFFHDLFSELDSRAIVASIVIFVIVVTVGALIIGQLARSSDIEKIKVSRNSFFDSSYRAPAKAKLDKLRHSMLPYKLSPIPNLDEIKIDPLKSPNKRQAYYVP
eukprot:NODE_190_length_15503_cov_0.365814.p14 type:complete len:106 gc:universal NODE_190_length_15503_cov_0.365814:3693-4010(+)